MFRALTQSDNTCNDVVLRRAGGPEAVRALPRAQPPRRRPLRSGRAPAPEPDRGLAVAAGFAHGNGFYKARNALPVEPRRAAFERYIDDPIDGATPNGIVDALARLQRGELLSPASTQRLLGIMSQYQDRARSG